MATKTNNVKFASPVSLNMQVCTLEPTVAHTFQQLCAPFVVGEHPCIRCGYLTINQVVSLTNSLITTKHAISFAKRCATRHWLVKVYDQLFPTNVSQQCQRSLLAKSHKTRQWSYLQMRSLENTTEKFLLLLQLACNEARFSRLCTHKNKPCTYTISQPIVRESACSLELSSM